MNPKVTVVIPSFNVRPYIRKCLDSVLGQTLKEIEVFVVDAFSSDGTREIIEEYVAKDDRIALIDDIKKSTGYSKNIAVDMASAPYYAIVESDDYVECDMLEKLYDTAERTGVDFVKANFSSFIGDGQSRYDFPKTVSLNSDDYERVINPREYKDCFRWVMFEWLGLYRVDFLRKNNIRHNESKGAAFQDTGFWFLTFAYANSVYLMREGFYHYRSDNPYASVKDPKKTMNVCHEYEYILEQINNSNILDFVSLRSQYVRGFFYDNCMALMRIDDDLKPDVIYKMREVLLKYGTDIDKSIFYERELEKYELLLKSAEDYIKLEEKQTLERQNNEKELLDKINGRKDIVIYGAGSYGANLQYFLSTRGYDVRAYVDSNEKKHGTKLNGLTIISLEQSRSLYDNTIYIVANREHYKEMYARLTQEGISEKDIYICDIEKCVKLLI